MVDHAVRVARKLDARAGGLANAVLRQFDPSPDARDHSRERLWSLARSGRQASAAFEVEVIPTSAAVTATNVRMFFILSSLLFGSLLSFRRVQEYDAPVVETCRVYFTCERGLSQLANARGGEVREFL